MGTHDPPDQDRDESSDARPSWTPLGRAFLIPPGPVHKDLLEVVRIVSSVHGDGPLPAIPLRLTALGLTRGRFRYDRNGPISISVNQRLPHRAFAAVHEIGHFLDFSGIGVPNVFASESSAEMEGWRTAVGRSRRTDELQRAVERLAGMLPPEEMTELDASLQPSELWARSYAQYIVVANGDRKLRASLMVHQSPNPARPVGIGHLLHWNDRDFAPIAGAIEALFRRLGWRSKP